MRLPTSLVVLCCATAFAAPAPAAKKKPIDVPQKEEAPVERPTPPPAPAPVAPVAPAPPKPAAAAKPSSAKPRLIVLDLVPGGGVEPAVVGAISEALTAEVGKRGYFEATSQKDVSTLLGIERERQMLGCSEEATSCFTEMAGAIGARFVLSGSLTRLGESYQLNLQTLDSAQARPLGRSTRIARDLVGVRALVPFALAEATATPAPQPPSRVLPLSLLGAGAAGVVGGGLLAFQAFGREDVLLNEVALADQQRGLVLKPLSAYQQEAAAIQQQKIIGLTASVVGAALIGLGVWLLPSAEQSGGTATALVPTANGAAWVGVFP